MTAAAYTTDLVDVIANITSITGWTALGGGASGLGFGPDFAMQGSNAVDKAVTASEKGHVYGGSAVTPGANTHFFVWVFLATPGLSNTLAQRGLTVALGTATTAYTQYHVEGNDTYGAAGRVARCYPIRHQTTANGSVPYRTLVGAPGANPSQFGAVTNITGTVKGSNLGISAIRYGTGLFVTAGDSGAPGTFTAAASTNDTTANRWGILTRLGGSFELQGRFVVGQSSAGTPTAAYFVASNQTISVVDTPHSLTDFTQFIIDHASTVFNLTNITVNALGTNNPGRLVYNNAATISALTGCVFAGLGISILRAGVSATGCTWRSCAAVTQNAAVLSGCQMASSTATAALLADTIANVSNTTFTSAGTGHAIEGFAAAGSYTLADLNFSGYAASNGSTGNEAIYVTATTGTVTLTVSGGSTPSVRTAGATVVVVSGATVTFSGFPSGTDVVILTAGTSTVLDSVDQQSGSSYAWAYQGTPTVDVGFIKPGYIPFYLRGLALGSTNATIPVALQLDRNYT